jgi:Sulfite exporter TauE/SafE
MDGIVERIGVFAVVGLFSGFVSGLFGIGGGIVRIPLFVYLLPLFGVAHPVVMHLAVGTSMALVLPSALASTRKQLALGNLELAFFRTWAVGIFVGVLIGTALLPVHLHRDSPGHLRALHAHGGRLRRFSQGSPGDCASGAARGGQARRGRGYRLLSRVDRNRRRHDGDPDPAGVQRAIGGRDRHCVGNRTGDGHRRHHRRRRRRLAHTESAGVFPGLRRPRHFCRDAADHLITAPIGVRAGHRLSEAWLRRIFTVLLFVIAIDLIRKLVS